MNNNKLYIISRSDLELSYQAVQGQHALAEFIFEHPQIARKWHKESNYLCFLVAKDEFELNNLIEKALALGLKISVFKEPDINNELTAIAIEPNEIAKKLCSKLKLAK